MLEEQKQEHSKKSFYLQSSLTVGQYKVSSELSTSERTKATVLLYIASGIAAMLLLCWSSFYIYSTDALYLHYSIRNSVSYIIFHPKVHKKAVLHTTFSKAQCSSLVGPIYTDNDVKKKARETLHIRYHYYKKNTNVHGLYRPHCHMLTYIRT